MSYFYRQLENHLERLNQANPKPKWTMNLLSRKADIPSGHFSLWKKGREDERGRLPTDLEIEKLANLDGLGLSHTELKAWYLLSKFDKHVLMAANDLLEKEESAK